MLSAQEKALEKSDFQGLLFGKNIFRTTHIVSTENLMSKLFDESRQMGTAWGRYSGGIASGAGTSDTPCASAARSCAARLRR